MALNDRILSLREEEEVRKRKRCLAKIKENNNSNQKIIRQNLGLMMIMLVMIISAYSKFIKLCILAYQLKEKRGGFEERQ